MGIASGGRSSRISDHNLSSHNICVCCFRSEAMCVFLKTILLLYYVFVCVYSCVWGDFVCLLAKGRLKGVCRVLQCAGNYQGIFVLFFMALILILRVCIYFWKYKKMSWVIVICGENMYISLLISRISAYERVF